MRIKRCHSSETGCILDRVKSVAGGLHQKCSLQVRHAALVLCTYNPPHLVKTNKNDIKWIKTQHAEKMEMGKTLKEIELSSAAKSK